MLRRFCSTREESDETRVAFLGTGEEEIKNGACSTLSGDEKSILESGDRLLRQETPDCYWWNSNT